MPFEHDDKSAGDLIRSAEWNAIGHEVERLGTDKVDRAGNDTIAGPLAVRGELTVGTANAGAAVRVLRRQEDASDPSHGALVLGTDAPTSASLRLGYGAGASWIQGQGQPALALNPHGGNVGVGVAAPQAPLHVGGNALVGGALGFGSTTRQMLNLWGTGYAAGVQASTLYLRTDSNFALYRGGSHNDGALDPGGGAVLLSTLTSGNVGLGTASPASRLSVAGSASVGAGYAGTAAPANGLIVEGNVGIGTTTPRSALDTGKGVMSGAANDYVKAQFTMSGGGNVTWAAGRLGWTKRFIAISANRGNAHATGHVNIFQPTANIPAQFVYDGAARSVTPEGVPLTAWEALYAVHAVGEGEAAVTYRIVRYTHAFDAPSNWILVAVVNADDGTVKLGTGQIIGGTASARAIATANNKVDLGASGWVDLPDMQLSLATTGNPVLVLFKTGGVQIIGSNQGRVRFRLLANHAEVASTLHEFHNQGWDLRDVALNWLWTPTAGTQNIRVQWLNERGTVSCCWYNDTRTLIAVEL